MGSVVGSLGLYAQALCDKIEILIDSQVEIQDILVSGVKTPVVVIVVRRLGFSNRDVGIEAVLDEFPVHETRTREWHAPHHGPPEVLVLRFLAAAQTASYVEFR